MFDVISKCWGSVECLDFVARWSTVATFVLPLIFGVIALVAEKHSKDLEDVQHKNEMTQVEMKNQKLVDDLKITEQQLQHVTEAQKPWTLPEEKERKLLSEFNPIPKGKIRVEYIQSDERRSLPFAEQLQKLLDKSGFDVWGYLGPFTRVNSPTLVGIDLSIKVQQTEAVAIGLQKALKTIGLNAPIKVRAPQDATYDDDQVVIYVGLKP